MAIEALGKGMVDGLRRLGKALDGKTVGKALDGNSAAIGRDALSVSPAARDNLLASVKHLDASDPQVQALLQKLGGLRAGEQATLLTDGTSMHLHEADGAWHDLPLQYLHDNRQGFLLRGTAPGTDLEYSTHVKIGVSHNHFYSLDRTLEGDLNTWGHNTIAKSEPNL